MHTNLSHGFRIGRWKVEPLNGAISGPDNRPHHLQPKVMDVLICLAENENEPVTREELLDRVWRERVVSDEVLTRAIGELRRALHDHREKPEYIETIPKRGYRLVCQVELPEGSSDKSTSESQQTRVSTSAGSNIRLFSRPILIVGAVGLVAIASIYVVYLAAFSTPTPTNSIAVLPFINMSSEADQQYFSDGITEEILNTLTTVPGLTVTARTSSFSFKGKDVPIPVVAETLGVDHILQGSVRKEGDRLRITAQLIDASNGYHLWSNTWNRTLTDIFSMQDEIAAAVVESLRVTLLDELPMARRTDPEAYALFLKGRTPARRFTKDGFEEATRLLIQALAIDPDYAAAWGQLAINQANQALWRFVNPAEGYARAEVSAQRALSIDSNNASALVVLGAVEMFLRWNFEEAGKWFRKAREVAPGDSVPLNALAIWTSYLGRTDAAIVLYQQAVDRDPLRNTALGNLARENILAGRFDTAKSQIEAMKKIAPESNYAAGLAGWLELSQGNFEEALRYSDQMKGPPHILRACALHGLGRFSEAKAELDGYQRRDTHHSYAVAEVYTCWGDADRAFEWLERAYEEHVANLIMLRSNETLVKLHNDPRWEALLQKLGLSDEHAKEIGL